MIIQKNRMKAIYRSEVRPFKLSLKNRLLMLLAYYHLYLTYTLNGFLFDLDQDMFADIQKIESLTRKCLPILQKRYNITKRLGTLDGVEQYFSGFIAFVDCIEQQQIPIYR